MRYIDAETIKYTNFTYGIVFTTRLDNIAFKEDIDAIPTADVAPVVHAHWVKRDSYVCDSDGKPVVKIGEIYVCSNCGLEEDKEYSYCHCGAKMDEVVPNDN